MNYTQAMNYIQAMTFIQRLILIAVLVAPLLPAADGPTGFPFQNETLRYSINWPSGLSLGEATMTAHRSESGWSFDVEFNAGIPAFPVADKYKASAGAAQRILQRADPGFVHLLDRVRDTFDPDRRMNPGRW